MLRVTLYLLLSLSLIACQSVSSKTSLYQQLGGMPGIEKVADRFVRLVIADPRVEQHFEKTDLDRFYEKLVEQLCQVSDGGCDYSGDDMVSVHQGMNISELEFNAVVEMLQQALREANISLPVQNQLLARLAPMRKDMLYR